MREDGRLRIYEENVEGVLSYGEPPETSDFSPDGEGEISWEQWYQILWEWKIASIKDSQCRRK